MDRERGKEWRWGGGVRASEVQAREGGTGWVGEKTDSVWCCC